MLERRIRAFAVMGITTMAAAAALAGTGAVPAQASSGVFLYLADSNCFLYAPAHNVQVEIQCSPSKPAQTWEAVRGAYFFTPSGTAVPAHELEIATGPLAGECLNDYWDDGNDVVSADSCQPTGADPNEYFWDQGTGAPSTFWYRNVGATDNNHDGVYFYLTDVAACTYGYAAPGDPLNDFLPGCGSFAEWHAVTP